jgi:lipoprotein NlpI
MRHIKTAVLFLSLAFATACEKVTCVMRVASPICSSASNGDAIRSRGLAQLDSGKFDRAIALFDSAIRINSNDADAYNSRGNAYAAKRDHNRAIANFDIAIRLRPTHAFAFRNRGVSYAARGDFDRAIPDYDRAITLKPDYASAFNSRGYAHQIKGNYELALQDFNRAIELAPDRPTAYRNRANVLFVLGRFGEAARDLERSMKFVDASTPRASRFDETGGYAVVWLHVAKKRAGIDDAAEFAANSTRVDSAYWPRPVISFFDGKLTANELVAQTALVADPKLRNDQRCGAEFFAGQAAMWRKQTAEARKRFETMTTTCSKQFLEHAIAMADLRRLGIASR